MTRVAYFKEPELALVTQKTKTFPAESTAPAMSTGSVDPASSMIKRGFHVTRPVAIGAASGLPSQ